ncbi:MAG: hypothetical protein RJQ09_15305 [Cyclobacteriaceae bacterium]
MDSLSKLTLKGHFENLRNDANLRGDSKAKRANAQESEFTNKFLELLIKAVALTEEVHATDADFIQEDHINDYRQMISLLNEFGISYKGKSDLLELSTESTPVWAAPKKPMQKATGRASKNTDEKRKAG